LNAARVTFLGSGTSHGVPMIGCTCATCRSTDPRDRRLRPSIHLALSSGASILVDTSTDLRQQALSSGLTRVDAILFTHSHADHILGLDEVRRFNMLQRTAIPAYADARTSADLRRSFHYIFDPPEERGG
jgi:phosphoribosyl 1,2-cyclic phosphate phosphodiesterase